MNYRQLLLSTGGGVISNGQMDAQSNSATIAIGLGGTGVSCLRNLKHQVYSRLQPDSPDAPIPEYKHIKFLAVDTDRKGLEADGKINSIDEATEFFGISSDNIRNLLDKVRVLAGYPECKWLKTADPDKGEVGLSIQSADAGAGGVRQIGRLLMIEHSAEFCLKIENLVNAAKEGLPGGSDVNIHIFAGMGGGTGAGTFLDVCYLVQKALQDVGEYGHALICGYFFLPDVNLSIPEIASGDTISKYIKANGFASMKELDYCMNFDQNRGSWNQQYKGFSIENVREAPVDICHLISAHSVKGKTLEKGYEYSMNVVSDFIMQFLTDSDINMKGHISNYKSAMAQVTKEHGANYRYCLLGASNGTVPMREITTYLSSKLFQNLSSVSKQLPSDDEIALFAKNNGITYQALRNKILEKTSYQMPMIELDWTLFTDMGETDLGLRGEIILPDTILSPYRDSYQSKMINAIEANAKSMTHPWSVEEISREAVGDSVSEVWKVYYALRDLVNDIKTGPFYAAALLNGAGRKNLVHLLNGILEQTNNDIKNFNGDMGLRAEAVKQARTAFLHPSGVFSRTAGNRKKAFDNFIAALAQYFTLDSQIKVLEKLSGVVNTMTEQFKGLYDRHFFIYERVFQNLLDTFAENYRTLSNSIVQKTTEDPFIMPLLKMDDSLRENLDKAVSALHMDDEARNFNGMLFNQPDVWLNGDEGKICKCVSNYLIKAFSEYTNKTLVDYLQIRFDTKAPALLVNNIFEKILRPLSEKADPLFWLSSGIYNISTASAIGYCSVPADAAVITTAADKLKAEHEELKLVKGKTADRLFILRVLCGVPLFGYNGIASYYEYYKNDRNNGKHLYELTDRDPRDWRNLNNLMPFSTFDHLSEEAEKDSETYEMAVKEGIVRKRPGTENEYQITVYPEGADIIQAGKEALESRNREKIVDALKKTRTFIAERQPEKFFAVSNDGAQGNEEKVRKDHVVGSKVMMGQLRAEMKKKADLEALNTQLEENLSDIEQKEEEEERRQKEAAQNKETFFEALYAGVLDYDIPRVVYKKELFGTTSEDVLSDPQTEPYGRYVPLYQAYVSYCAKKDEEKKEISDATDKRMSNVKDSKDEMKAACETLRETFSDAYMGALQSQARKLPNTKEIVDFLIEFRGGIDNFRTMYGLF